MLPPSRFVDSPPGEAPAVERTAPPSVRPGGLLAWAIKLCLAVSVVALGATIYLSRALDGGTTRQREARAAFLDPETTGSIGGAAARTVLDPCTASGLRR